MIGLTIWSDSHGYGGAFSLRWSKSYAWLVVDVSLLFRVIHHLECNWERRGDFLFDNSDCLLGNSEASGGLVVTWNQVHGFTGGVGNSQSQIIDLVGNWKKKQQPMFQLNWASTELVWTSHDRITVALSLNPFTPKSDQF